MLDRYASKALDEDAVPADEFASASDESGGSPGRLPAAFSGFCRADETWSAHLSFFASLIDLRGLFR
jgi:hypothetical protein